MKRNPDTRTRDWIPARRALLVFALFLWGVLAAGSHRVNAASGAAATGHPLATQAALRALEQGGNAIDAAVSAALTLGVVDSHNSGIGGGCLILLRLATGEFVAVDGRETAPAASTPDMFIRNGEVVPELSLVGALAAGVPGELAALHHVSRRYGRLPMAQLLREAASIAEAGFPLNQPYADALRREAATIRKFPEAAAIFLRPDGEPHRQGEILRQPDLAGTYRAIADHGIRWFYRGPFAERTEAWMRENGGIMTRRDLRRYRVKLREPLVTSYHQWTVVGFPPPSSGGVHVAQVLNILEHFNLAGMNPRQPDFVHVVAEAMKAAFADRAHWLGDSDFARVPRGLIAENYAASLATRIDPHRVTPIETHGTPPGWDKDHFGRHTTHLSTADSEGNWVALTATINTSFGSKVVIPGTGVLLNNEMDDFVAQPGATNYFGLVGAEANAVAPRKRPLSSMSPTILLEGEQPVLAVGGAGGPTIISQVILAILGVTDQGATVAAALREPRFHHQWRPDELVMEAGWGDQVTTELSRRGHRVRTVRELGLSQAVQRTPTGWIATADPRGGGSGGVWEDSPGEAEP